jgi:hypothetical protein
VSIVRAPVWHECGTAQPQRATHRRWCTRAREGQLAGVKLDLIPLVAAALVLTAGLLNLRYSQDKDDLAGKGVRARLAVRARRHPVAIRVQAACFNIAFLLYITWGIATWIG